MFAFVLNKIRKLHSDVQTRLVIFPLPYGVTHYERPNMILGSQVIGITHTKPASPRSLPSPFSLSEELPNNLLFKAKGKEIF